MVIEDLSVWNFEIEIQVDWPVLISVLLRLLISVLLRLLISVLLRQLDNQLEYNGLLVFMKASHVV